MLILKPLIFISYFLTYFPVIINSILKGKRASILHFPKEFEVSCSSIAIRGPITFSAREFRKL